MPQSRYEGFVPGRLEATITRLGRALGLRIPCLTKQLSEPRPSHENSSHLLIDSSQGQKAERGRGNLAEIPEIPALECMSLLIRDLES